MSAVLGCAVAPCPALTLLMSYANDLGLEEKSLIYSFLVETPSPEYVNQKVIKQRLLLELAFLPALQDADN